MASLILGITNKRINSLSRSMTNTRAISGVRLKEPCSVVNPVFMLTNFNNVQNYNYLNWSGHGYYYIDDIVYTTNDIVEINTHRDALSTFADDIRNSTQILSYADEAHWDSVIDDVRLSPENVEGSGDLFTTDFGMHFIWGVQSTVIFRVMDCMKGGVKTYATSMYNFLTTMCDLSGTAIDDALNTGKFDLAQIGEDICKFIGVLGGTGSWRDNIISAIFIPLQYSEYEETEVGQIFIGGVPVNIACKPLNIVRLFYKEVKINVDDYLTNSAKQLKFLKNERWCCWQARTPTGYTDINNDFLKTAVQIKIALSFDGTTGDWTIKVSNAYNEKQIFSTFFGNLGLDIMSYIGTGQSAGSMMFNVGANIAKIGFGAMAAGQASTVVTETDPQTNRIRHNKFGEITSVTKGATTTTKTTPGASPMQIGSGIFGDLAQFGSNASARSGNTASNYTSLHLMPATNNGASMFTLCFTNWTNYTIYDFLVPDMIARYKAFCNLHGFPCNHMERIGDISGYCRCASASLSISGATVAEVSSINSFLNSGIFVES